MSFPVADHGLIFTNLDSQTSADEEKERSRAGRFEHLGVIQ